MFGVSTLGELNQGEVILALTLLSRAIVGLNRQVLLVIQGYYRKLFWTLNVGYLKNGRVDVDGDDDDQDLERVQKIPSV